MTNQELEKIYYEAYRPVYWTAMSLLKNEADAEDITQETFITLIKSYDTIKDKSKVVSFLKKTAANKCLDKIKLTKTVNMEDEFFENVEDVPENFLPDSYLESEDTRKVIMDIINNTLSDDVRRTIILYYYDEMSVKEISEVLSVPQGTILWRLSFARKKIKKEVEKYENDNDTRLFAMGLPFLTRLFYTEAEQVQIKPMPASLSAILSASNMNPALGAGINTAAASSVKAGAKAASTAVKKGTDSMIKRIFIAIMVGLLVGGAASVILNRTVFKKDTSNNGISKISVTDKEGTTETGVSDTTVSEPDNSGSSDVAPKNTAAPTETTAPKNTAAPTDTTEPTEPTEPSTTDASPSNGKEVVFGKYEGTDFEWIIIAEDDEGYLLISKYILDPMPYNNKTEKVNWETCFLRKWLNGEFYEETFNDSEKAQILTTVNTNPGNPDYKVAGGNDTQDNVFLLSVDEAEQYFSSDDARKATYRKNPDNEGYWWLRSAGYSNYAAAFVFYLGSISPSGYGTTEEDNIGVRPVIRVKKDALNVTPNNGGTNADTDPDLIGTWYYENGGEKLYMTFQEDGTVYQKREKNGVVKQAETATYVIIEKGVIAFIQNGNELERDDYTIEGDKLTLQEQNRNGRITLVRVR
ncbi:MAG: sigma-70 family RNA polymerase sigma factor [Saccharofermentanaceae bacterium]|nr:sigma-70 family RNA polymerase sigma factor [Saccharofermentanaceae bacterium]